MPPLIKVAVVEDDLRTRESLLKLLRHSSEMVCVGAFASAEEAEREIPTLHADVVLMDINLPRVSGVECVGTLKRACPSQQFLMLTTCDDSEVVFNALRSGASGYLLKRSVVEELIPAIMDVHRGGAPMSMQIARKVVTHFHQIHQPALRDVDQLTTREQEILGLLAKGLPYKQIGDQLCISPSTVHGHLHKIYGKLHVQSRTEAVVKFLGK